MSLELIEVAAAVLAAAVGWLVRTVIAHGRQIATIETSVSGIGDRIQAHVARVDEMHRDTSAQLRELRGDMKTLCGDVKTLCERTEWLQRTTDRHERFLDAGKMDPSS